MAVSVTETSPRPPHSVSGCQPRPFSSADVRLDPDTAYSRLIVSEDEIVRIRHQAEAAKQPKKVLPPQHCPGQSVHLLGPALLGGGGGEQVRMGPGRVQGERRLEGGGLLIPPLWILGDQAEEGQ